MIRIVRAAALLCTVLALSPIAVQASVSKYDPARGSSAKDLRAHEVIAVEPLVDAVEIRERDRGDEAELRAIVAEAGRAFADHLVKRLGESGAFDSVARAPSDEATLVIGGRITKYVRGNAVARYSGVFGRSRFAATVELRDAKTGKLLGDLDVEVASSVIPGAVNVIQSVGQFMEGSAIRVRDEILIARGDRRREETGRQGRLREKYSD